MKDVHKIWPVFDPLPLYPHILDFYRQKFTVASGFGIPLLEQHRKGAAMLWNKIYNTHQYEKTVTNPS